jgi:hypothetical protein
MKQIWLICCLLIGLIAANYGQVTHPSLGAPEKAKGLQKELKLTDEQTENIASIYKECAERCEKIKKAEHGNSDNEVKSIRPLRAATIKKIRAVLKPDQAAKYDVLIKQTKKSGGNDWGLLCY